MSDFASTTTICVIGLGYVGLPLAQAFAKKFRVIGFDIDKLKLQNLILSNTQPKLVFTDRTEEIANADFYLICVPTPITPALDPDFTYVQKAATLAGKCLKKGSTVILESTVSPGTTGGLVRPILEKESGLKCGEGFRLGYSPERINPGDTQHSIDRVTKIVAGWDDETTELVARLYLNITPQVYRARDIQTAEAAKVLENIQRDLNIAVMNELSLIFDKMGLNTAEVIDAAATKWNFQRYSPGLVGGDCIPAAPYYLIQKSRELGYVPRLLLAARAVSDSIPIHIAELTVEALMSAGKSAGSSKVVILGLTYKENSDDIRRAPAREIIEALKKHGVEVWGHDPLVKDIETTFGIRPWNMPQENSRVDAIIITVGHDSFKKLTLDDLREMLSSPPVLIDVRGLFAKSQADSKGFIYRTL